MREEIEAAVTFLTRLLAKSVDPGGGVSAGGKDSSSSSTTNSNGLINSSGNNTSANNSGKDSSTTTKNDYQNFNNHNNHSNNNNHNATTNQPLTEERIKKFSQKLIDILTQRFQNHWYPGHPSKGQAFRCIRINQNCRIDCSIELACQQVGISYESLRLPVELTLWIDPSEVTCRFGEHKGSFCIVAKLGDGRQENFAESINIDELEQRSIDRSKQSFENSRMKMKPLHASQQQRQLLAAKQVARNQQATLQSQSPIMNPFSATTLASSSALNNNVSYHAMNGVNSLSNGGLTTPNNHHITSHGSPVGGSLTNGFTVDYAPLGTSNNGLPTTVFGGIGPVGAGGNGAAAGGLTFQPAPGAGGAGNAGSQPFQYPPAAQYFNHFHHQLPQAANFHHQQVAAALHNSASWSPNSHLFSTSATNKFIAGLAGGSPQNPASSTPPSTSVSGGQLQSGGRTSLSSNHMSSSPGGGGVGSVSFRSIQVNSSLTSSSVSTSSSTSQVSSNSKSNSQQLSTSTVLTNGGSGLTNTNNNTNNGNSNANNNNSSNNGNTGGANPNAPVFIPRGFMHSNFSSFNLSAPPFTPASLANNFQTIDQASSNGSNVTKDRRSFGSNVSSAVTSSAISPSVVASTGSPATGTPLVANNRF